MVKGKASKDRPRSSGKYRIKLSFLHYLPVHWFAAHTSLFAANRRKKAGSPDGSDTPIENQLVNLESYQQPPIIDVIRGPSVDNLQITESDMAAVRTFVQI